MSINLAEAVKLKSIITRRIQERAMQVHSLTHVIIEKGEQPKTPDYTLEMLEAELKELRYDSRILDALIYRANIDHTVVFKNEEMPIVEAMNLRANYVQKPFFAKTLDPKKKKHSTIILVMQCFTV